jgi:hypothetical protein
MNAEVEHRCQKIILVELYTDSVERTLHLLVKDIPRNVCEGMLFQHGGVTPDFSCHMHNC